MPVRVNVPLPDLIKAAAPLITELIVLLLPTCRMKLLRVLPTLKFVASVALEVREMVSTSPAPSFNVPTAVLIVPFAPEALALSLEETTAPPTVPLMKKQKALYVAATPSSLCTTIWRLWVDIVRITVLRILFHS
ncbi:MAG: hypothetical protein HQL96_15285 [Magnetococcales bacterium]|nr:hypothetical protein [Magnetococcales bacterium]